MDVRGIYCLYFQQKVGKKFFSLYHTHTNFAFFGDAGVTYLVKCRKYPLSVQKETTEHEFDRKKSVTGIHRSTSR
jgi:hypothetical protein